MSEEGKDNVMPLKKVDFSPYTYRRLLRNLKKVWGNIEYHNWEYYARQQGYTKSQMEEGKEKFDAMKKSIETKIDLLLHRVNDMIKSADSGKKDYDYPITCHSVGAGFTLEEHLSHLQPKVAFDKVFRDPRDSKFRYRRSSDTL